MLQWLCLYTLGSRGSWELKTFLEICLISSRIDQKFKNKREIHRFLKRKLARNRGQLKRSWKRFAGVVGAVSLGGVVASGLALNEPQFCLKKSPDRAAIGLRSCVDRAVDSRSKTVWWSWRWMPLIPWWKSSTLALNAPRSHANRATIAWRSGHDHASIVVLREVRSTVRSLEVELDRTDVSARCSEIAEDHDRPMKRDEIATKIGRSWRIHVSSGKPVDRIHLLFIWARALDGDRVDFVSTTSTHFKQYPWIRRPLCRHVSCKVRPVWEHSPTRRKHWETKRLNRGSASIR